MSIKSKPLALTVILSVFSNCADGNKISHERSDSREQNEDGTFSAEDHSLANQSAPSNPVAINGVNLVSLQFSRAVYIPATRTYRVYVDAVSNGEKVSLGGRSVTWQHLVNDVPFRNCFTPTNGDHHQECQITASQVGLKGTFLTSSLSDLTGLSVKGRKKIGGFEEVKLTDSFSQVSAVASWATTDSYKLVAHGSTIYANMRPDDQSGNTFMNQIQLSETTATAKRLPWPSVGDFSFAGVSGFVATASRGVLISMNTSNQQVMLPISFASQQFEPVVVSSASSGTNTSISSGSWGSQVAVFSVDMNLTSGAGVLKLVFNQTAFSGPSPTMSETKISVAGSESSQILSDNALFINDSFYILMSSGSTSPNFIFKCTPTESGLCNNPKIIPLNLPNTFEKRSKGVLWKELDGEILCWGQGSTANDPSQPEPAADGFRFNPITEKVSYIPMSTSTHFGAGRFAAKGFNVNGLAVIFGSGVSPSNQNQVSKGFALNPATNEYLSLAGSPLTNENAVSSFFGSVELPGKDGAVDRLVLVTHQLPTAAGSAAEYQTNLFRWKDDY